MLRQLDVDAYAGGNIVVALFLALFAAWKLPRGAVAYRDKVLGELNLRRRKAFMVEGKTPEAIDTMIEEVQSNSQGGVLLPLATACNPCIIAAFGVGLASRRFFNTSHTRSIRHPLWRWSEITARSAFRVTTRF